MTKHTISITSNALDPSDLQVNPGDEVCWSSSVDGYMAMITSLSNYSIFTQSVQNLTIGGNQTSATYTVQANIIVGGLIYVVTFLPETTGKTELSTLNGTINVTAASRS